MKRVSEVQALRHTARVFLAQSRHFARRGNRQCLAQTAYKGWSKNHNRADTDDRLDYTIEREAHQSGATGQLNPNWVEWLMGWPIGHTALKPLETDKFREWQQQHSIY